MHLQYVFISIFEKPIFVKLEKETVLLAAATLPSTTHTLLHLPVEPCSSATQPTERVDITAHQQSMM